MSQVFDKLARRLVEFVEVAHLNGGSGVERFKIVAVTPLRIEAVASDLVLEDGEPDFTVGGWFRQYATQYDLRVGDEVWCVREGLEWHAIDVTDPGRQVPWSFVGHTHSDPQGGTTGPGTRNSPDGGSPP